MLKKLILKVLYDYKGFGKIFSPYIYIKLQKIINAGGINLTSVNSIFKHYYVPLYYALMTWQNYKIYYIRSIWGLGALKKFQSPNLYKMMKSEKKDKERNWQVLKCGWLLDQCHKKFISNMVKRQQWETTRKYVHCMPAGVYVSYKERKGICRHEDWLVRLGWYPVSLKPI